jgi:hypothetical protein
MLRAQVRMLAPLSETDRRRFMKMLKILVGDVEDRPVASPDSGDDMR